MIIERVKVRFNRMSLFWKVYGFIVIILVLVVGFAEFILEPGVGGILQKFYGGFKPWHEAVMWGVSICIPSLACGYILSRMLSSKLEKMAKASKSLARGNLEVRLPENGNEKDAFDMLAYNFNEMASAIKVQQNNDRRLLADISHELRSPLTRIAVVTDLLSRRHKEEKSVELLLRLEKEIQQMNESISLLMEQARDKLLYSSLKKSVDLTAILKELVDDFSFQGEMQNIRIKSNIDNNILIYGNTLLIERMVGNILSNAVFYSPANKKIELNAVLDEDNVYVVIRDFGPGVAEDQLEEIFRAFYRVDSSRSRTSGGVGLGLALAREVAIQMGGDIVASNVHPGLQVTITLPIYFEDKE